MTLVSGRMLAFVLRAADARGVERRSLLEGLAVDPARLDERSSRIEWDDLCVALDRLAELCGGPAALIEVGHSLARAPVLGPRLSRLFGIALGPVQLYRIAAGWQGPRDFPNTISELEIEPGPRIRVGIRLRDGERPSEPFFHLTRGAFEAAPAMLGLQPSRVEAEISERSARYRITPPPSRSLVGRLGRSLGLLRASSAALEELEAQHEELRASEARIRSLAESSRDVLAEWGADARCLFVTAAVERLGIRSDAFRQDPLGRVHPDDREALVSALARCLSGGSVEETTFRLLGPGDEWRWLESVASRFTTPEGEPRAITVIRDVTERRELEAQVRHSQKMEAVGRLAGGLAHDFNNLLTIIAGCADLLQHDLRGDEAAMDTVRRIAEASQRAGAVTRQLLTIAKGRVVETRVLSLDGVVRGLESLVRRSLGEDVELVLRSAPEDVRIRADPGQIDQVVLNLALNARDAMPGGGRLEITTGRAVGAEVRRAGLGSGRFAVLRVRDHGAGMAPEIQARAFDPFFTTKPAGRGTGLGLSVVYGIARQAGGTARIDSAPGSGTTVSVYLPATEEAPTPRREPRATRGEGAGERLLLLEDDAEVRSVCQEGLTRLGYEVDAAGGIEEARRLLSRRGEGVRLVITDLVLRRGGGAELARELAASRPELPVLFISGHGRGAVPALRSSDALLEKPFSIATLGRAVRELLDADRQTPDQTVH